jgi:hypothetical protein
MDIITAKDMATLEYGIIFPITKDDFIKIKGNILRKLHPDKNDGECNVEELNKSLEMFRTIIDNFDQINGYTNTGELSGTRTRSGELLVDLGKGLGDLQNGCNCNVCKGKGYNINEMPIFGKSASCPHCENGFIRSAPCNACKGTGRFKTRSGFDVKCKACDGTKIHTYTRPRACPVCNGFWFFFGFSIIGHTKEYHTCYHCGGKGQIPIHNPVFQKGSMQVIKSSIDKITKEKQDPKRLSRTFNKLISKIKPQTRPIFF